MTEAIIVALITAAAAIIGQALISNRSSRDLYAKLDKQQAITDTKIEALTAEVKKHNSFGDRITRIETIVAALDHHN